MWFKRVQLGLIHMAVAVTLVPINSTLNRVMIKELAIPAFLVAIFVSLPYILSPVQVAIGSYSDKHPVLGYRRTPYILTGLILCVGGTLLAPYAAFLLVERSALSILVGLLAFGLWGMGYNLSAVSYLSLASEIDEKRSTTIATMFFLMIVGIIFMAIIIGQIVDPYSPEALHRAFWVSGGVAMALGLVGLIRLEQRGHGVGERTGQERHSWSEMWRVIAGNRQARLFFFYLLLLLAAILGQDVLLEPYGGEAFGLSPAQTTRITSLWGVCVLLTLSLTGIFQARIPRRTAVLLGNWGALAGFILIAGSGLIGASSVFYGGVVLLGLGTGISTVSNLSLMLDMTTPQNVGLFIGAWGVANALSRLVGQVISGALRDLVAGVTGNAVAGYVIVFAFLVAFILVAQVLFRSVDVVIFRKRAAEQSKSLVEAVAMMHEAQG